MYKTVIGERELPYNGDYINGIAIAQMIDIVKREEYKRDDGVGACVPEVSLSKEHLHVNFSVAVEYKSKRLDFLEYYDSWFPGLQYGSRVLLVEPKRNGVRHGIIGEFGKLGRSQYGFTSINEDWGKAAWESYAFIIRNEWDGEYGQFLKKWGKCDKDDTITKFGFDVFRVGRFYSSIAKSNKDCAAFTFPSETIRADDEWPVGERGPIKGYDYLLLLPRSRKMARLRKQDDCETTSECFQVYRGDANLVKGEMIKGLAGSRIYKEETRDAYLFQGAVKTDDGQVYLKATPTRESCDLAIGAPVQYYFDAWRWSDLLGVVSKWIQFWVEQRHYFVL